MKNREVQKALFLTTYIQKIHQKADKYARHRYSRFLIILKLWLFHFKLLLKSSLYSHSAYQDSTVHILLKPSAGIGDHCHFLKYAYALKQKFKDRISIDVLLESKDEFLKDTLYKYTPFIHHIFLKKAPRHDCEIKVVRFPQVDFYDVRRMDRANVDVNEYLKRLVIFAQSNSDALLSDYVGRCFAEVLNLTRENQADITGDLKMDHIDDFMITINTDHQEQILKKFGLYRKKFIIVQTGAGVHFQKAKNDTRQWPIDDYERLVRLLKKNDPEHILVQCGVALHPVISEIDLNLLGKTTFAEMLILLINADLLISQEGGYPILRHYLSRKKSCVIFGPTDINFFGFSENINLSQKKCRGCEWLNNDWYHHCIRLSNKCLNMPGPVEVMRQLKLKGK